MPKAAETFATFSLKQMKEITSIALFCDLGFVDKLQIKG